MIIETIYTFYTRAVSTWPNFLAFYGIKWGLPLRPLSITLKAFASRRPRKLSGIRSKDERNGWKCYLFFKVIMEMPYYFLCPIRLNEGKTSRMALPKMGVCASGQGQWGRRWQKNCGRIRKEKSQIKKKNEWLVQMAKLMDRPSNLYSFVHITDYNS